MAHVLRFDEGWRFDSGMHFDQLVPDTPGRKGSKNMAGDIIPKGRVNYRDWLTNAKTQAPIRGPIIGWTPPR